MSVVSNVDELKELTEEMKGHYATLHDEFTKDEQWYQLDEDIDIGLPSEYKSQGVLLPTARTIVDTAVDHISPQFRDILVPRKSSTLSATNKAKDQQRFYSASLTWLENQSPSSPYRMANKQLGIYGMAVTKTTYVEDWDVAKGEDEEGIRAEFMPFRHRVLHPAEVFPDPFNDEAQWVIQVNDRMIGDLFNIYGKFNTHKRLTDRAEVIEFWDRGERAVLVDGEPIIDLVEHSWGEHPYTIGDSGLGFISLDRKPEHRYMGYLRFVREVLKSESRNYSINDIVLKASGWPIQVASGPGASQLAGIEMQYGKIYELPPDTDLRQLTPELPPPLVEAHRFTTSTILSEATAPRPLVGLRNPGTTSGRDQNIQLGQARLRYQGMAQASEMMLTAIARKLGTYMENVVEHPVNISLGTTENEYKEVSPKTFKGVRPVKVTVNVLEPDNEFGKKQAVAQELTVGTIDRETAVEELHPDKDTEKMLRNIRKDALERSPAVQQLLSTIVAEKLSQDEEIMEKLQAAIEKAQVAESTEAGARGKDVRLNDGDKDTQDAIQRGVESSPA